MHRLTTVLLLAASLGAAAQPRTVKSAIIKMQTEFTFPENFGNNFGGGGPGGGGEGGGRMMMMGGGGESTSTMYVREHMTKVESVSDFGNNTVITDRQAKKTTTLIEAMGRKTGFYSTEADEQAMRARMDSMRDARRDSLEKLGLQFAAPPKPEIVYTEETRKIAGLACKKAVIRNRGQRGQVSETEVWYCPDFKLEPGTMGGGGGQGGGTRGMMAMAGVGGLDQLQGFPMEYTVERGNGMKISMKVTKVQLDADIDGKTFEIPKGFDIKPMSEMQNGRGMFMIRSGG